MGIRFGPSGLGAVKDAVTNLEHYSKLGLKACEIAFTYGIYINDEDAVRIGKKAKELGIKLSIHAPYWINLNSAEQKKIEESKNRIINCCRIGELLGCELVVFHCGFYGQIDRETSYLNMKKAIIELLDEIKENRWKIKIAPETMGKINVFGSLDEILKLVDETGCSFCVDFAHLWARKQGKIEYTEIYQKLKKYEKLHCHFSGIEFGEKGEKNHKLTPEIQMKKLLDALPKNKEITIINESPDPVGDSVKMLKLL